MVPPNCGGLHQQSANETTGCCATGQVAQPEAQIFSLIDLRKHTKHRLKLKE